MAVGASPGLALYHAVRREAGLGSVVLKPEGATNAARQRLIQTGPILESNRSNWSREEKCVLYSQSRCWRSWHLGAPQERRRAGWTRFRANSHLPGADSSKQYSPVYSACTT